MYVYVRIQYYNLMKCHPRITVSGIGTSRVLGIGMAVRSLAVRVVYR